MSRYVITIGSFITTGLNLFPCSSMCYYLLLNHLPLQYKLDLQNKQILIIILITSQLKGLPNYIIGTSWLNENNIELQIMEDRLIWII